MNMPSRKTITASIFIGFVLLFLGALGWYFGAPFFDNNSSSEFSEEGESRGFTFFPFGRGSGDVQPTFPVTDPNESTNTGGDVLPSGEQPQIPVDRFRNISSEPTAGAFIFRRQVGGNSVFDTGRTIETAIRYVLVESGHVYEAEEDTQIVKRISNTTIPRISEAHFADFDSIIVRYLDPTTDVVRTFSGSLVSREEVEGEDEGELQKLSGVFLPEDIQDISINKSGEVLYTQKTGAGSVAIVTDLSGQEKKQIFSSPLSEWKPDWSRRDNTISLTQYPSYVSHGATQLLNRSTEVVTPFISGRRGLETLLSPDGTQALVSFRSNDGLSLFVRNQDGRFIDTGLNTYAQKCVWSSDNVLAYCAVPNNSISSEAPDLWYQGVETYSDDVWRVQATDGSTREVFSPFSEANVTLDIFDIKLSADERYLYFRDKQNLYLWSYLLEL